MPVSSADEANAFLRSGIRLAAEGDHSEAHRCFLAALDREPEMAAGWEHLGHTLGHMGLWGDAAKALIRAAELDPENIACRSTLGFLYGNLSLPEDSIHWHGEALALQPNSLILRLNHAFVLPPVARSSEQLAQLRERCSSLLNGIEKDDGLVSTPAAMSCHPFYLSTHGRNDRALLEAYGRLMIRCFGDAPLVAQEASAPRWNAPGKVRLGFLSSYFSDHSVGRAFEGLIRHLSRDEIDVILIHLAGAKHDATTRQLEACCQEVVCLSTSLEESTSQLRQLNLDALFFSDIGANPVMTQLASRRYAPLQVTGWGWPQTSGMPAIDAYISGDLVEPEMAQDHYSEVLIRLPDLPCCYLSESIEVSPLTRDYFFLPPDDLLIGCFQSLEKLHPDFDAVLEDLIVAVPDAWLVFVESDLTSSTQVFLERLARTAPTASQRLILLGRMSRPDFLGLAGCIDVVLDSIYFGSGISMFETFHAGAPTVTLEGDFLRSRMVAAAYRLMGVKQPPVAQTLNDYVDLAVRLSRDTAMRARLRQEICEKARMNLYDRLDYVRGFERYILESCGRVSAL